MSSDLSSCLSFLVVLPVLVQSQSYNDVICRRPWYFNSPRPAPMRCPTPSFFFYYECCGEFLENCCWRVRPEPIYVTVAIVLVLLLLCSCCCVVGFLVKNRKRKGEKRLETSNRQTETENVVSFERSTQMSETEDRRRSYAAARDRDIDYQYF